MALMGILVYAIPPVMYFLSHFPESSRGILVVPSFVVCSMQSWLGVALLGIFIAGKSAYTKYNKRVQTNHIRNF
jgi:SSS family solute:Na+ symporter